MSKSERKKRKEKDEGKVSLKEKGENGKEETKETRDLKHDDAEETDEVEENMRKKKDDKSSKGKELSEQTLKDTQERNGARKDNKSEEKDIANKKNSKTDSAQDGKVDRSEKRDGKKSDEEKKKNVEEEDDANAERTSSEKGGDTRKRNALKTKDITDEDTSLLEDEAEDKKSADSKRVSIVDQILENLKIVISGSKEFNLADVRELANIEGASCEMPSLVSAALASELSLITDERGEWCVMKGKIRKGKKEWSDYEGFLKEYRHIIEGGVKEFYRYFSIQESTYVSQLRVIPSDKIGFEIKLDTSANNDVRTLWYDNAQAFQILPGGVHYDTIPVVMNPILADFQLETERFLFDAVDVGREMREWVGHFVARKDENWIYNLRLIYGTNDSFWMRCPHPRLVGLWLNLIPNANYISVPYALRFIGPRVATRAANIQTTLANLNVTTTQASSLPALAVSPVTETNRTDFESIIKAQLLPGQIWIRIEYENSDSVDLNAMGAIAAKLLLCASPLSRNVDPETCAVTDRVIARWLTQNGYRKSDNEANPLAVRRKGGQASAFAALGTQVGMGSGWCNANVPDFANVVPPALYEGINRVPHIGGAPPQRREINFENMGTEYTSPLMTQLEDALRELCTDNKKIGEPILKWFLSIFPMYQQYMCDFNRHSRMYGETGFRLSDRRIDEMQNLAEGVGALNEAANRPLLLEVRYDSVYKYLRALPEKIEPPEDLGKQLNAESLISAELQRVLSAFLIMLDRVATDNQAVGYSNKAIFRMAMSSTMSNHYAKKILELCIGDRAMSRLQIAVLQRIRDRFDEFEAVFFQRYAQIVDANPESFGFTFRVFKRYIELPILTEDEYRQRRRTGIIYDTNVMAQQGVPINRLSWREMFGALRTFSLLTRLKSANEYVVLPIPISYDEVLTTGLSDAESPPISISNINSDVINLEESEVLNISKFNRQFLKPDMRAAFRPDQMALGADGLKFWTVSAPTLTMPFDAGSILGQWMRIRVRNWKQYVEFRNPLAFSGEPQTIHTNHPS